MKKLVIDRSRWIRGEGSMVSRLERHSDGKQCCVGQFCEKVLGISSPGLRGYASIDQVTEPPLWMLDGTNWTPSHAEGYHVPLAQFLYTANDAEGISDELREPWIAAGFACGGYEVEFVDGPVST